MARLSHRLEHLLLSSLMGLTRLPSAKLADSIGRTLGTITHSILASRRVIAYDNLKAAMGDELTEAEINDIVVKVFENIGQTMIEIGRFSKLGLTGARSLADPAGAKIIKEVHALGKGGLVVSPHFGNWELLGAWIVSIGFPMDLLVGTMHNPLVNDMLVEARKKTGLGVISLEKSMRSCFKALRSGRIAGMTPDQHASAGNIIMEFFGRPASMAKGPALLSIRTGSPIIPMVFRRIDFEHHEAYCGEPIYPPKSGDEEADILFMTKKYFEFFEEQIRKYPDQWLWTHRRWKKIEPVSPKGQPKI